MAGGNLRDTFQGNVCDHGQHNVNYGWPDWYETASSSLRECILVGLVQEQRANSTLIGFEGYLNTTTPFSFEEHNGIWKSSRRYHDFDMSDEYLTKCEYPRFWTEFGEMVGRNVTDQLIGCRNSDFDQYGDVASFGLYPGSWPLHFPISNI